MTTRESAGAIVTVDLNAVAGNWRSLKARLAPGADCRAVVKADAYGLGVRRIAPAFGLSDTTRPIRAFNRPRRLAWMIAWRLVPSPEQQTAMVRLRLPIAGFTVYSVPSTVNCTLCTTHEVSFWIFDSSWPLGCTPTTRSTS